MIPEINLYLQEGIKSIKNVEYVSKSTIFLFLKLFPKRQLYLSCPKYNTTCCVDVKYVTLELTARNKYNYVVAKELTFLVSSKT